MALQAKVEHAFSTVRGRVGDRELANNELERVLATSDDPAERRAAWEAGKQVGAAVADDVLALVELRNRVAPSAATATGSPSPWPPATSTRPGWSGSWTRSSWPPASRSWPPRPSSTPA